MLRKVLTNLLINEQDILIDLANGSLSLDLSQIEQNHTFQMILISKSRSFNHPNLRSAIHGHSISLTDDDSSLPLAIGSLRQVEEESAIVHCSQNEPNPGILAMLNHHSYG